MRSRSCRILFALAAAAGVCAQTRPTDTPANLVGEIHDSITGAPIERAHVGVSRFVSGNQERYGSFTNAEGKFVLTGVPAGSYSLTLERVGYVNLESGGMAMQVQLRSGDTRDLSKLKLTPTGVITGRVLDANGAPVETISVVAEMSGRTERSAATDDRGTFRLGGLRPGKYRVKTQSNQIPTPPEIRTDGTAEVHYAATYYPSALDEKSATRVEVRPAAEVTGVDIRLVATPIVRISGKVSGLPPGTANANVSIRPQGMGSQTRADGTFEIWRIDPGKYTLTAYVYSQAGSQQYSSAALPIEVGETDVENVELQVMAPFELSGQVDYEDEDARKPPAPPTPPGGAPATASQQPRPVPPRRLMLRNPDGQMNTMPGDIAEDGSFTLPRVSPGRYRVYFSGTPVYVKSMRLGTVAFDGPVLDVSNGGGGALTVRVASSKGSVSGVLSDAKGPIGGGRVALLEDAAIRMSPMFSMTKEDGSFLFKGVAPGKYLLFPVEGGDLNAATNLRPEDVEDIAENIEVGDGAAVTKDLKRREGK